MRTRKVIFLGFGVAAIIAGWFLFAWHYQPSSVPLVSIALVGYTNISSSKALMQGDWLRAEMLLTNEGAVSISYASWGGEPYGWARAQTAMGWTNGELAPHFTGSSTLVRPHSSSTFSVWLPAGTLRWQCGFSVRAASIQERAAGRMFDSGWWNRLSPLSEWGLRLLPLTNGSRSVLIRSYEAIACGGLPTSILRFTLTGLPTNRSG